MLQAFENPGGASSEESRDFFLVETDSWESLSASDNKKKQL